VQFSVQGDHLHLLCETESEHDLARGLQGLAIRIAKSLNRFWHRRSGSVFAERYFARAVSTAKEIKRALAYVLDNARKHRAWSSPSHPDPFSSGRWYTAWFGPEVVCRPLRPPPVATARDWYLMMPSFRNLGADFVPGQHPKEREPIEALLAL
jgi:hypothetical protein